MTTIKHAGLTAHLSYDDRDPSNKGWFAEYRDENGDCYSDSMKIGEVDMPRRADAHKKAARVALAALKAEAARRAK
jgi:hypothetical protein